MRAVNAGFRPGGRAVDLRRTRVTEAGSSTNLWFDMVNDRRSLYGAARSHRVRLSGTVERSADPVEDKRPGVTEAEVRHRVLPTSHL